MKVCYKCKKQLSLEHFHKNARRPDGLQNYCKSCAKIRNAEYYLATPERNGQRRANNIKARQIARQVVVSHLATNHCVDCGASDMVVLEFDHVRGEKLGNISWMVGTGRSAETIKAEIEKCDVRCANCHRRVTASRGGWHSMQVD